MPVRSHLRAGELRAAKSTLTRPLRVAAFGSLFLWGELSRSQSETALLWRALHCTHSRPIASSLALAADLGSSHVLPHTIYFLRRFDQISWAAAAAKNELRADEQKRGKVSSDMERSAAGGLTGHGGRQTPCCCRNGCVPCSPSFAVLARGPPPLRATTQCLVLWHLLRLLARI
jgi:hypothetical protein